MSYMKQLVMEITEMFESGMDSEQIALSLDCDVNLVYNAINFLYNDKRETVH